MTNLSGTNVAAPIVPFTTADTYPTHSAKYGMGGWKAVVDATTRNAIPASLLEDGAIVYVVSELQPYVYVAGSWLKLVTATTYATTSDATALTRSDVALTPASIAPLVGTLQSSITAAQTSANTANTGVTTAQSTIGAVQTNLTTAQTAIAANLNSINAVKATIVTAGNGLTGGGTLGANLSIAAAVATTDDVTAATSNALLLTPVSISGVVTDLNSSVINAATNLIRTQTALVQHFAFQ